MRRFVARQRLAGILRQRRLGIERIDVRRPAVHEQVDDALGLGRKVRRARRQRVGVDHVLGGEQAFAAEELSQAERGEAHAAAAQQLAAGEQLIEGGVR